MNNTLTQNVNGDSGVVVSMRPPQPIYEEGYTPEFSEAGMALTFVNRNKDNLKYVKKQSKWYHWTGTYWKQEETALAYDLVGKECHLAAARAKANELTKEYVKSLSKAATRGAIETIARANRLLAVEPEIWNNDNWLLNTPAGIIDLRTFENIGSNPRKYCSKITAVAPGGKCPIWTHFLKKVTGGDSCLQAYLKRMCGYFLTGSTEEQSLFFMYGPGGNGKGIFINTIGAILNNYQVISPAATFAEQKNQRHETELAHLWDARLVISQETERGQHWAEARIKSLTGGDRISARFMRGDFFDFEPKFKLCISGNHKPQLRSVDDSIRRRFNIIPFNVTIPREEQDHRLFEKLKDEYPGILDWMLEGCAEWQEQGLNPPEAVLAATKDYLDHEDTLALWLSDMCVTANSYKDNQSFYKEAEVAKVYKEKPTLASLFASSSKYAESAHVASGNDKHLKAELMKRGFDTGNSNKGIVMIGLRLKTDYELHRDGFFGDPDR
jgi:putative DNA primase/helicase